MSEPLPVMKTTQAYEEGRQAAREELARGAERKIVQEHLDAPALEGDQYFEQFDSLEDAVTESKTEVYVASIRRLGVFQKRNKVIRVKPRKKAKKK